MKVAAVCLSTTHAKSCDGTELEMETQSDTRHNLKTTPTPTTNRLFALREAAASLSFIYNKKKKKICLKADVTMCIANKLKKNQ